MATLPPIKSFVTATLLVALAVGAAVVFRRLPHANLSLLFLTVVLFIAARCGLWPAIFASVLSFLALNFFFTEPYYTFAVEEEGDFATLLFFLAMATLTGNLAARMRDEMAKNRAALERVSALLDFSRRMSAAGGADEALEALAQRLAAALHTRCVALRPNALGVLEAAAETDPYRPAGERFDAPGIELHKEALAEMLVQGRATNVPGWTVFPLVSGGHTLGIAAAQITDIETDRRALAEGLCDQASIAVERAKLVDSLRAAQLVSETERLRSSLLSSVSHDLRTPLVSIIGSTTSLLEYRSVLKPDDRHALLRTVLDEAQRLNRYIQNLLDMTRFGQQPFELHRQWVDLNDLISSAVERLDSILSHASLQVQVSPEAALLNVQGALIEQVLVNLLDNAASFSPQDGLIRIEARQCDDAVVIDVSNEGPLIPEEERDRIFDMFYRAEQGDRNRPGTGLGLAICRSVIAAHDGTIVADENRDGTGTLIRITLPPSASVAVRPGS